MLAVSGVQKSDPSQMQIGKSQKLGVITSKVTAPVGAKTCVTLPCNRVLFGKEYGTQLSAYIQNIMLVCVLQDPCDVVPFLICPMLQAH